MFRLIYEPEKFCSGKDQNAKNRYEGRLGEAETDSARYKNKKIVSPNCPQKVSTLTNVINKLKNCQ